MEKDHSKTIEFHLLASLKPLKKFRFAMASNLTRKIKFPSPLEDLINLMGDFSVKLSGHHIFYKFGYQRTPTLDSIQPRLIMWTTSDDKKIYHLKLERTGRPLFERLFVDSHPVQDQAKPVIDHGFSVNSIEGINLLEKTNQCKKVYEYVVRHCGIFCQDILGSSVISVFEDLYRHKSLTTLWRASYGMCFADPESKFKLYKKSSIIDRLSTYLGVILKQTTWFVKKCLETEFLNISPEEKQSITSVYIESISINIIKLRYFYRQTMLLPLGQTSGRFKIIQGKFDESEKIILRVTVHFIEHTEKLEKVTLDMIKRWFSEEQGSNLSPNIYKLILWKILDTNDNIDLTIKFNQGEIEALRLSFLDQDGTKNVDPEHLAIPDINCADKTMDLLHNFLACQLSFDVQSSVDIGRHNLMFTYRGVHLLSRYNRSLLMSNSTCTLSIVEQRSACSSPSELDAIQLTKLTSMNHKMMYCLLSEGEVLAIDLKNSLVEGKIQKKDLIKAKFKDATKIECSNTMVVLLDKCSISEDTRLTLVVLYLKESLADVSDSITKLDFEECFELDMNQNHLTKFGVSDLNDHQHNHVNPDAWRGIIRRRDTKRNFKVFYRGLLLVDQQYVENTLESTACRWFRKIKDGDDDSLKMAKGSLLIHHSASYHGGLSKDQFFSFESNLTPYLLCRLKSDDLTNFALFKIFRERFIVLGKSMFTFKLKSCMKNLMMDFKTNWWSIDYRNLGKPLRLVGLRGLEIQTIKVKFV